MKEILNVKTDKELTKKWGISYSTLDTWKNRDNIPEKRILDFSFKYQVSSHWLLTGEGDIYLKKEKKDESGDDYYSIPIISIKAGAGSSGTNLDAIDIVEDSKSLKISKTLFKTPPKGTIRAMQVDGYSMIPMLYPDSWILFDESSEYKGDGLYVINWNNILMVKLLQVDLKNGKLKIISKNPDYESWEVDFDEEQRVFSIVGKVVRCVV